MKILFPLLVFGSQALAIWPGYVPNPLRNIRAQTYDYAAPKFWRELPLEYDLRKIKKGTAAIRNQKSCGSCWAFGTKSTMESLFMLRDGADHEVSGQWMNDCAPANFYGCSGGDMAFDKFKVGFGAIYESEYPIKYQAQDNQCQTSFLKTHYHETIIDWGFIKNDVDSMKQAMFQNESPLAVTIGSGGMGQGGWVTSCQEAGTDHIVYIVGWLDGATHGYPAGSYWITANSWGTGWGDHGYAYYLTRASDGTICASLGQDEVVLVNYKPACVNQPKADAGNDQVIIEGPGHATSVSIGTASLANMLSYKWTPSDGLSDANRAQPIASPTVSTVYTVQVTADCGAATSQMKVHVLKEQL